MFLDLIWIEEDSATTNLPTDSSLPLQLQLWDWQVSFPSLMSVLDCWYQCSAQVGMRLGHRLLDKSRFLGLPQEESSYFLMATMFDGGRRWNMAWIKVPSKCSYNIRIIETWNLLDIQACEWTPVSWNWAHFLTTCFKSVPPCTYVTLAHRRDKEDFNRTARCLFTTPHKRLSWKLRLYCFGYYSQRDRHRLKLRRTQVEVFRCSLVWYAILAHAKTPANPPLPSTPASDEMQFNAQTHSVSLVIGTGQQCFFWQEQSVR